jgi:hypothetical protein
LAWREILKIALSPQKLELVLTHIYITWQSNATNHKKAYGTLLFCCFSAHSLGQVKGDLKKMYPKLSDRVEYMHKRYGDRVEGSTKEMYGKHKGRNN